MYSNRIALLAAVAGVSLFAAIPAASAANNQLGGKTVPGVCMLSRQAVIANSKVGQAADKRLKQLADESRSQLDTERKPLQNEIQQFQSTAKSMSESERKSKGQALQQRLQAFRAKAQGLNQRIQLTRSSVMERIGKEVQPLIGSVYHRNHCGLLLDRDAVLGGNMSNDLTSDVVDALNKKMTTIHFNLHKLPKPDKQDHHGH